MNKFSGSLGVFMSFFVLSLSASLNDDMNPFFNKLGFLSKPRPLQKFGRDKQQTMPQAVHCMQEHRLRGIQLFSMQLPSMNSGCDGAGMILGSYSYINEEKRHERKLFRFGP